MKRIAIIQARMGSTRLAGKSLLMLGHKPVLQWVSDAARAISGLDDVVIATSTNSSDDAIAAFCEAHQLACYRGDEAHVLKRYVEAARAHDADVIMRLTGDCPLLDAHLCGEILVMLTHGNYDYCSNTLNPSYPDGLDCEVLTRDALERVYAAADNRALFTEHVTSYINYHRHAFRVGHVVAPLRGLSRYRWTLDTEADYAFLQGVAACLPQERSPTYLEVLSVLEHKPELLALNAHHARNEGFRKSMKADIPHFTFENSAQMLTQAERTIPLGSQTFSKSKTAYQPHFAPLFASHGLGGHVWDVDGNRFIDLVSGLLPNLLGYCDPEIDEAIRQQLNQGISLSLASTLERQLAEKLVQHIPCAEKVRFAKNGTDATSACVRLARAFTGRERILSCGYHGWQDWHIGITSKNKGIPAATAALTHAAPYNDLEAIEALLTQHQGDIAALILEPMTFDLPKEGYLQDLKDLLHAHGALLIFDEVITGFRFHIGGAQAYFGVTPDLAAFGKALGNGMPISAIAGRAEIMNEMEQVFLSGTFGGETLSLAAAIAVIEKLEREPVIDSLWRKGAALNVGVAALIAQHGLQDWIGIKGADVWATLTFAAQENTPAYVSKSHLLHLLYQRGVLTLGTHNVCYAHSEDDWQHALAAYDAAFATFKEDIARSGGALQSVMPFEALKPLFTVRPSS